MADSTTPEIRCTSVVNGRAISFEWPVDRHLQAIYGLLTHGNRKVTLTKDNGDEYAYERVDS